MSDFKPSDIPGCTAWIEFDADGKPTDRLKEHTGRASPVVIAGKAASVCVGFDHELTDGEIASLKRHAQSLSPAETKADQPITTTGPKT